MAPLHEQLLLEETRNGRASTSTEGNAVPRLGEVFPGVISRWAPAPPEGPAVPRVEAESWGSGAFDAWVFDRWADEVASARPLAIAICGERAACERAALEVLLRVQRLLPRRNEASRCPLFDRLLQLHREAHDLTRPRTRRMLDQSVDAWQWVIRLDPRASLEAQAAGLLRGLDAIPGEPPSPSSIAESAGLDPSSVSRVAELARGPASSDPEVALVHDAASLSFLSLGSHAALLDAGWEQTELEVASRLRSLRSESARWLELIRMHPEVARMVRVHMARS